MIVIIVSYTNSFNIYEQFVIVSLFIFKNIIKYEIILHVNTSKVHPMKQLCLLEDELCFTLLQNSPKIEIKGEVWSKVHPFASKVASKDELCLHNHVIDGMLIESNLNLLRENLKSYITWFMDFDPTYPNIDTLASFIFTGQVEELLQKSSEHEQSEEFSKRVGVIRDTLYKFNFSRFKKMIKLPAMKAIILYFNKLYFNKLYFDYFIVSWILRHLILSHWARTRRLDFRFFQMSEEDQKLIQHNLIDLKL